MISTRITSWLMLALFVLLVFACTVETQSPRSLIHRLVLIPKILHIKKYRFIELPEKEHCLNAFRCTSSDSSTNVTWKQENCVPKSIRDSRVSFIFNLAIVFIVGLVGNILTLAAFPYAWIYYRNSFPGVITFTVNQALKGTRGYSTTRFSNHYSYPTRKIILLARVVE